MITALTLNQEEDLRPLSGLLWQQGVPHRIFEEKGMQVLKVDSPQAKEIVCELYQRWRSGDVRIEQVEGGAPAPSLTVARWRGVPASLSLIALSIAGFLVFYLGDIRILSALTYSDFQVVEGDIRFLPQQGQFWRLLTPIFLHFGWLHIAFNSLWVWELGGRMERRLGSAAVIFLAVVVGIGSNTAQYLYGGPSLFGGMSGVVYGMLGFCWVVGTRLSDPVLRLPPGIVVFMLGWLVFCMVGPTQLLGSGSIANAAHLGGLVLGCALGGMFLAIRPR
jgi:GlpG protein